MSRLLTAAAYAMHNMPIGTAFNAPVLMEEDAYDVAAYIMSQKRPEKANLDQDFRFGSRSRSTLHTALTSTVSAWSSTGRPVRADPRKSEGTGRGVTHGECR